MQREICLMLFVCEYADISLCRQVHCLSFSLGIPRWMDNVPLHFSLFCVRSRVFIQFLSPVQRIAAELHKQIRSKLMAGNRWVKSWCNMEVNQWQDRSGDKTRIIIETHTVLQMKKRKSKKKRLKKPVKVGLFGTSSGVFTLAGDKATGDRSR